MVGNSKNNRRIEPYRISKEISTEEKYERDENQIKKTSKLKDCAKIRQE
jgi:hypothetical protein